MMKPINKLLQTINCWTSRFGNDILWLVIHYTGSGNGTDTAYDNVVYLTRPQSAGHEGSAHFFVDETSIWQSIDTNYSAWHVGDYDGPTSKNGCTNMNSIGIEMCSRKNAGGQWYIPDETVENTVELVQYLQSIYPNTKICRHYDVTGKICPEPFVRNPLLWEDFLERVSAMTKEEKAKFDALVEKVKDLDYQNKELEKKIELTNIAYRTEYDVPDWAQPTIKKLVKHGYLKGTSEGELNLSYDLVRSLVIIDRAGGFGV